jgi:hypothetical protein
MDYESVTNTSFDFAAPGKAHCWDDFVCGRTHGEFNIDL